MSLAQLKSSQTNALEDTKYGKSPKGSYLKYQVSHTESNFLVDMDISCVTRKNECVTIQVYPRFPLTDLEENQNHNLTDSQNNFISSLSVSEDKINETERDRKSVV